MRMQKVISEAKALRHRVVVRAPNMAGVLCFSMYLVQKPRLLHQTQRPNLACISTYTNSAGIQGGITTACWCPSYFKYGHLLRLQDMSYKSMPVCYDDYDIPMLVHCIVQSLSVNTDVPGAEYGNHVSDETLGRYRCSSSGTPPNTSNPTSC